MRTMIAAVLLTAFAAAPLYAAEAGVAVRLAEVKGEVSARASSAAAWTAVKDGVMMSPGGEVKTGPGSSVVLAFSDGNKVKLEAATAFAVEGATTKSTALRLFSGKITAWVKRANKADFTVRHRAGVAAVRGTSFGMEGSETEMMVALFSGMLDLVDAFGRLSSMSPGQLAAMNAAAGLQGISSQPPGTQAPPEPAVEPPPPPVAAAQTGTPPPPESVPVETTQTGTSSPVQESTTGNSQETTTTVSPSSPP